MVLIFHHSPNFQSNLCDRLSSFSVCCTISKPNCNRNLYIELPLCSCKVKPCSSQHLHCAALLVKNTPLFAIKYNHVSGRIFFGQSRNRVVITRIMGCHQTALALLQGALCGSSRGQRPNSTGIVFSNTHFK